MKVYFFSICILIFSASLKAQVFYNSKETYDIRNLISETEFIEQNNLTSISFNHNENHFIFFFYLNTYDDVYIVLIENGQFKVADYLGKKEYLSLSEMTFEVLVEGSIFESLSCTDFISPDNNYELECFEVGKTFKPVLVNNYPDIGLGLIYYYEGDNLLYSAID